MLRSPEVIRIRELFFITAARFLFPAIKWDYLR